MVDQVDKLLDRAERYADEGQFELAKQLTEQAYRLLKNREAEGVPIFFDSSKILAGQITADRITAGTITSAQIRKF